MRYLRIAAVVLAGAACGLGTENSFGPSIDIISPNTATVRGIVDFRANVVDDDGVTEVRFYADGVLLATDEVAPYFTSWTTTGLADGVHTLRVEADDESGNTASKSKSVTVSNATPNIR